jgi:hypothetical protein
MEVRVAFLDVVEEGRTVENDAQDEEEEESLPSPQLWGALMMMTMHWRI